MEKKGIAIKFSLRKITTEQFAIIEEAYQPNKHVNLSTSLKFSTNLEDSLVRVLCIFKFQIENQVFLLIGVACHFQLDKDAIDSFLDSDKEILVLPRGFITHLAVLTVGTARGVLHAKTENSLFNKYIIPTLNISDLITEDVQLKLDNS